jgi:hypothetical protein
MVYDFQKMSALLRPVADIRGLLFLCAFNAKTFRSIGGQNKSKVDNCTTKLSQLSRKSWCASKLLWDLAYRGTEKICKAFLVPLWAVHEG